MTDPLNISNEMAQFDRKNREFYDSLTDEQKKKFSPYLMIRWGSSVQGSRDLQEFYVIATNERLNQHFFDISRHPKLQWLLATTVSPGMGTQRHQWIAPRKKEPGASGIRKQLSGLFPHLKDDEIEVLAKITTKKELDDYIRDHGHSK
jgi:hypothetical protein|tara:strand:- start:474 stop:917 length:444 start_codon:yes stop_codon:yes gene_type:complete